MHKQVGGTEPILSLIILLNACLLQPGCRIAVKFNKITGEENKEEKEEKKENSLVNKLGTWRVESNLTV